ncbi:MAG: serine hydrolase [Pseudomonadota bacterium]
MATTLQNPATAFPDGLRRDTPSSVGVDASQILGFIDDVEAAELELHELMIWRDGAVVAEGWHWPYVADERRITHSVTKSITACAIGMLIDDGQLSLTDKVCRFFPEVEVAPDSPIARMTVEDLLTMRSGQGSEVSGSIWRGITTSWIDEFFRIPLDHEPGTVYVYSSASSYMLSAIVTRVTGETMFDFLKPRLFEPLGITDVTWDVGPDGLNPGGNGLSLTTADSLKIGILHAQNGVWGGQRILSEWWVARATGTIEGVPNYGYHWVVRDGYYMALGQFVQVIMVVPAFNAVLVINCAMEESKVLLPHLDRHFPAAFGGKVDSDADQRLARRLKDWAAAPAFPSSAMGDGASFTGDWTFDANDLGLSSLSLSFAPQEMRFSLTDGEGKHTVVAGLDSWKKAPSYLPGATLHHGYRMEATPTVAGARWLAGNRLEIVLHYTESAFRDTITLSVDDDRLTMDRAVNINSGARAWPTLTATRKAA